MANNFTFLHSLHLLLFTSFCLHVSLERNINFVNEILRLKYNAFRKFLAQNIFVRKHNDENFSHKLFGMKLMQTKIKQFTVYSVSCFDVHVLLLHTHVSTFLSFVLDKRVQVCQIFHYSLQNLSKWWLYCHCWLG